MTWKFEWITDWKTIYSEEFQLQWLNWYNLDPSSSVFSHPIPGKIWLDTYLPIRNLKPLFCIARNNNTTLFLPLIHWTKNWKNSFQQVIIPVGHSDYDYHDPLIVGEKTIDWNLFYFTLFNEIRKTQTFDKIEINGIRTSITQSNWKEEADYCPSCNIENFKNKEDFLNSLTTSLRGDLRRQERRMEEKGKLSFHTYSGETIQAALDKLPEFLMFHSKRWPKAYKAPGLHQHLIKYGMPAGIVDFTELRIDDQPVSLHLGFKDNDRFYYYMPAIHPDFSSYSPGKVHLLYLVTKSISERLKVFDHLRGDENYKTGWTNDVQLLYSYTEKSDKLVSNLRNWMAEKGKNLVNRLLGC